MHLCTLTWWTMCCYQLEQRSRDLEGSYNEERVLIKVEEMFITHDSWNTVHIMYSMLTHTH